MSKVYEEWKKHETFPTDVLSTIKVEYVAPQGSSQFDYIVNSSSSNKVENSTYSKPPVRADEATRSASSAASSAAVDDSKKRASKEKEKEKEKEKDSVSLI